jgi:hypothetical protein
MWMKWVGHVTQVGREEMCYILVGGVEGETVWETDVGVD